MNFSKDKSKMQIPFNMFYQKCWFNLVCSLQKYLLKLITALFVLGLITCIFRTNNSVAQVQNTSFETIEKSSYFEQLGQSVISIQAKSLNQTKMIPFSNLSLSDHHAYKLVDVDSIELIPLADTYINLYNPDMNYGQEFVLSVYGRGGNSRGRFDGSSAGFDHVSYLKFQLPEIPGLIVSASLQLYSTSDGFGGGIFFLNPIEDIIDWDENLVTWNTKPTINPEHGEPGTFLDYLEDINTNEWYSFNVTPVFAYEFEYYSFAIVMREKLHTRWASKESSEPPKLKIYYTKNTYDTEFYQASGNVQYYANNIPVDNVNITLSDSSSTSHSQTDESGIFSFENLGNNVDFSIIPDKNSDEDIPPYTILAYDASLVLQASTGFIELSDEQKIAADVDLDGNIISFDAATIARYAIGWPNLLENYVGYWQFLPNRYDFKLTNTDIDSFNYNAIVLGDVHGGWYADQFKKSTIKTQLDIGNIICENDTISIDFTVPNQYQIQSFDFCLEYDSKSMKYIGVSYSKELNNFLFNKNKIDYTIRLNGYSSNVSKITTPIFTLKFEYLNGSNPSVQITHFGINDFVPIQSTIEIEDYLTLIPKEFQVLNGYPNPFNSEISFDILIPESDILEIKIYNQLGKRVKVIQDGLVEKGYHSYVWKGLNERNQKISSGLYFVLFNYKSQIIKHKILLLK